MYYICTRCIYMIRIVAPKKAACSLPRVRV